MMFYRELKTLNYDDVFKVEFLENGEVRKTIDNNIDSVLITFDINYATVLIVYRHYDKNDDSKGYSLHTINSIDDLKLYQIVEIDLRKELKIM